METLKHGLSGRPVKLVSNQDGTFSLAARPDRYPAITRVPHKIEIETVDMVRGYTLHVDDTDAVYYEMNGIVYKTSDFKTETQVVNPATLDSRLNRAAWLCKTRKSGKYILSAYKAVTSLGQIWVSSDLQNWTKKLDVSTIDGLGDSYFRPSNCWHCYDGKDDILLVSTYGFYSADNPNPCNHLYLSLDEGDTWDLIWETPVKSTTDNNHIHAVAYDPWQGWIWVCYGDGNNRGISYSYNMGVDWVTVAQGAFGKGGWQPTAVVPLITGAAFGTDNSLADGILMWERPRDNVPSDVGYAWKKLHYTNVAHIARRGAQVSPLIAYIPLVKRGGVTIGVTGDGGLSWHAAATFAKGLPFEHGLTNPDSQGWVYGSGSMRFRVSEWVDVTAWVEGGHIV